MLTLIAGLIPLIAQFGPKLVHDITDLIHGTPQQSGDTEDAYIARINAMISAKLDEAAKLDAEVEGTTAPTA